MILTIKAMETKVTFVIEILQVTTLGGLGLSSRSEKLIEKNHLFLACYMLHAEKWKSGKGPGNEARANINNSLYEKKKQSFAMCLPPLIHIRLLQ